MKKISLVIIVVILLLVFASCGASTDNTIVCNSCGEQISSLSNFCQFCGASLEIQGSTNDNNADDSKDETVDDSQSDTSNSDDTNNENDSSEKLDDPNLIKELIKVYGLKMTINSADGVNVYVDWENLSEKEIKYMHFNLELYNRVGDALTCDITGKKDIWIYQTGPIPQGKGMYNVYSYNSDVAQRPFRSDVPYSEYKNDNRNGWEGIYWDSVWYNSQAYCVKIIGVKIEYQDGTVFTAKDYSFSNNFEYHLSVIGDDVFNFAKTEN